MIRIAGNPRYQKKAGLYLGGMLLVWSLLAFPMLFAIKVQPGFEFFAFLWFSCYAVLCFSAAYSFTTYVSYFCIKSPKILPELDETPSNKSVAIACPIRNEEVGLYERLVYSLNGNVGKQIDVWILSDSDADQEERERQIVNQLAEKYTDAKIFYRRREEHKHFKPGNLSEWLFCHGGQYYDYFFVLDADSLVPPGTVERLLRKAEHPYNRDIWHFQCVTSIIHDFTRFAHFQKIALDIHERLVFPTVNSICGQWISYGHSNLINTKGFVLAMPPTDELSHDIWDAAAIDRLGYRSVSVADVVVYEEAPANDIVARKRDKRWTQGSIRALKLLGDNRVSIVERFFVFHGAMQYINNVVFCLWILLQFWNMTCWNYHATYFEINMKIGAFGVNKTLFLTTLFSVMTFLIYPFLVAKTKQDVKDFFSVILFSNITMIGNIVNGTLNVLSVFISPLKSWVPMEKNPFAQNGIMLMVKKTLPTSLFSLFLVLGALWTDHLLWVIFTSPILIGGILSPLVCWWGGQARKLPAVKPMTQKEEIERPVFVEEKSDKELVVV